MCKKLSEVIWERQSYFTNAQRGLVLKAVNVAQLCDLTASIEFDVYFYC